MPSEIPHFGLYQGEPILPPSKQRESMTVEELQEKYPLRYKIYCQEGNETEPVDGVSPEVIVRRLQILNNLDRYVTANRGHGKSRVLREKQLAVFRDTHDFLETGETEGYVEAPTGFGKTVLFSEMIRATNQRTLVVVPTKLLVDQTYQRLREYNPDLDVGRYFSDKKERNKQVIVTTYQSLVISCGGVRPEDIDLLILDEVHQSLTNVRIEAVGRFDTPVKLGFTATPEYTQDKRVENLLNNQIHAVSLREAVETGLLCSFSVFLAETDVDLSNVSVDQDGDYNDRELEAAINIYSRNKSAVELYRRLNEERPGLSKAVTYCVSIAHAQEVARVFNEAGIPAAAIWSDQDKDERRRILEAYGRGEIKVLTNVNVLTEGFDDPQAALCLNLRPTLSKVVAKQRGGRVLRLDPNNPRKHAIVVDYLDRNENKRTAQVTFAQVAEGAQIINPLVIDVGGTGSSGDGKGHRDTIFGGEELFDLAGLHVITISQEVLRITRELEIAQNESDLEEIKENELPLTHDGLREIFKAYHAQSYDKALQIKAELEVGHPEYFETRLKGKHRIVAVTLGGRKAFVDRMSSEGFQLRDQNILQVQDNDLLLVEKRLRKIFRTSWKKLAPLIKEVKEKLEAEYPEYFEKRKNKKHIIDAVVGDGKQIFIDAIVSLGIDLQDKAQIQPIKETELSLANQRLNDVFIGWRLDLVTTAQAVRVMLEAEHPEYFVSRESGAQIVDAVTEEGRQDFIDAMVATGVKLKNK
ncbi:MAG: DEAD/DEAH box helicase [bacterium]|nr:DEAD/DEAH box helicase [bacterium]